MSWKSLAIGFCFGLLAGGLITRTVCPPRSKHLPPEKRQERILKKLTSELKLTDDQQKAISGILADGRKDLDGRMSGMREAFDAVRTQTNARIRELLTPDQQKKFDELNAKMEERWKEHRSKSASQPG